MADRTVNININYKVNTADVIRAQAASRQADQATEKLRQSTKAYGDAATKAGNDASKALKGVADSSKGASNNVNSLAKNFNELYSGVKTFLAAGIVREVADMTLGMAKLSGNVDGVSRAFKRAFPDAISLLSKLRTATKGTVTDFELMQRTLQATNLGVGVKELPVLFEFAAARAQQTGESVDYLVDSIVRGIGRKSLLILDNLGLSATRLKEQFNGASLASQSVADVTKGVAEIAKVELEKMGGYIETAATKADRLTAAFEAARQKLAEKITSNGGAALIDFLTGSLTGLTALLTGSPLQSARDQEIQIEALKEVERIQERAKGTQQERIEFIQQEINSRVQLIGTYNDSIAALKAEREELKKTNPYSDRLDSITASIKGYNLAKKSVQEVQEQLKVYLETLQKTDETTTTQVDSLDALEAKLKDLNEQLQNTDNISKKEGIALARSIKQEITLTQDKIDAIKLQIYWEEELQTRRAKLRKDKKGEEVSLPKDKALQDFLSLTNQTIKAIEPVNLKVTPYIPQDEWSKLQDAVIQNRQLIEQATENIIRDVATFELNKEAEKYDAMIKMAQDHYDAQIELAGDNEKAKSAIRKKESKEIEELTKKRADAEKKAALGGIIVNTALGIIKAIATATSVYDGLIKSLVVAAEGAAQYTVASNARYYAKGEINIKGPGTETSDSIPAFLSKGESVMTAKETKRSMGLLTAIRNNKIDDRILRGIDFSGGRQQNFDDNRIVTVLEKIESKKSPDLVKVGRQVYETYEDKNKHKRWVRSKSI